MKQGELAGNNASCQLKDVWNDGSDQRKSSAPGTQAAMSLKFFTRSCVVAIASCVLIACSGGNGSSAPAAQPRVSQDTPASDTPASDTPEDAGDHEIPPLDDDSDDAIDAIGGSHYFRPAEYRYAVNLPLQFVEMSTGKKLSVRVTLPANEKGEPAPGPFPVILTQSGYNTNLLSYLFMGTPGNLMLGATDPFVVKRGYAQVAVDALGTGASEGGWELFGEEEQIGFADMVDWVHEQPWSNGKVGVAGVSYMAISSLFAAQRRPDSIDAVFASLPMGDAMRGIVGTGGLLNAHFMSTWMRITQILSTQNVQTALANPKHMAHLMNVNKEHVAQIESYYMPLIDDALWNAPYVTYDGEFWRTRSPLEHIDQIKAPTMIFGALHDLFQRDEPLLYENLSSRGIDARLVIYNGSHFPNFVTSHVGNNAVAPIDFLMLQWFDKYLKGMDTGTENIPQVVQFVKNYPTESTPEEFRNDSFATTTTWPHPQAAAERWHLRGDGSLTRAVPGEDEPGHTMTNPEHPFGRAYRSDGLLGFEVHINDGTECSRSYEQWILGLTLPKACFSNADKSTQQRLTFETAPMAEDFYINGPIQADIWIDSTVTEAVVAVQVEELSDKQSLPITNGQLLASMRAVDESRSRFMSGEMIHPFHYFTEEKSQLLVPGEVVKMQVEIFPTSAIIRKGNRLRIAISPSNQAQGMLNYPRQALAEGGVTTIHNSPQYPSSIVLPVVPTSALN